MRYPSDARPWWQQMLRMYLQWAAQRGMRVEVLLQDAERGVAKLAVAGFGAYRLLARERGLHVLESDDENGTTRRLGVHVTVVPDGAAATTAPSPPEQGERQVCRRYRLAPSPLARDSRMGWRTGRVDRVLAGDFDVMR